MFDLFCNRSDSVTSNLGRSPPFFIEGARLSSCRDLLLSNNLFHWVLHNNTVSGLRSGGVELSLPYVWQYNRNFTHSVYISANRIVDNHDLRVSVEGHFCRLRIDGNRLEDNVSWRGLISLSGVEKELVVCGNTLRRNTGPYMVGVSIDSHTSALGNVTAGISRNVITDNRAAADAPRPTHVIALRGLQRVNVTDNLLGGNRADHVLLAGSRVSSLPAEMRAQRNWWGTRDPSRIRQLIVDFDDWNEYVPVAFSPFLAEAALDGPQQTEFTSGDGDDLDRLGGLLTRDVTLR